MYNPAFQFAFHYFSQMVVLKNGLILEKSVLFRTPLPKLKSTSLWFRSKLSSFHIFVFTRVMWKRLLSDGMHLPKVRFLVRRYSSKLGVQMSHSQTRIFYTHIFLLLLSSYLWNELVQFLGGNVLQDSVSCYKNRTKLQKGFKWYHITLC